MPTSSYSLVLKNDPIQVLCEIACSSAPGAAQQASSSASRAIGFRRQAARKNDPNNKAWRFFGACQGLWRRLAG